MRIVLAIALWTASVASTYALDAHNKTDRLPPIATTGPLTPTCYRVYAPPGNPSAADFGIWRGRVRIEKFDCPPLQKADRQK